MWSDPQLDALRIVEDAITIQRARDEEKCHEAWVRFAAALFPSDLFAQCESPALGAKAAGEAADLVLAEYRARFCPEVES